MMLIKINFKLECDFCQSMIFDYNQPLPLKTSSEVLSLNNVNIADIQKDIEILYEDHFHKIDDKMYCRICIQKVQLIINSHLKS